LAGRLRSSTDPYRIFKAVRSVVDASGVLARKHHRVLDSTILDEAVGADDLDPDQQDAVGLFALVAAQDVEPGEKESTWRVARRVAKDRVISTVDPGARHDHKSMSVRKDGFQGASLDRAAHRDRHRGEDHPGEHARRSRPCRARDGKANRARDPPRPRPRIGSDEDGPPGQASPARHQANALPRDEFP
jgi:hypothetical protein